MLDLCYLRVLVALTWTGHLSSVAKKKRPAFAGRYGLASLNSCAGHQRFVPRRNRGIPRSAGPNRCYGSTIRNCASPCGRCCFSSEPSGWNAKDCYAARSTVEHYASWSAAARLAVWTSSSASKCSAEGRPACCYSMTGVPGSFATRSYALGWHGYPNS